MRFESIEKKEIDNSSDRLITEQAWYHSQSNRQNGIALNDTYRLYIAYYHGHSGYARGNWSATAKAGAKRASGMAMAYARQLRSCGGW